MKKRVGIIGAGVSGLAAMKCCLDEDMQPVCWEQGKDIGGLWAYSNDVHDGHPSLYNCCVINTSKEMTCYSDFPIPKEFPNFMSHRFFKRYLDMYTEAHRLRNYILFGTRVTKAEKAPDFAKSGKWVITVRNIHSESVYIDTVDALMVCNGHLHEPNIPNIKGMKSFKGRILHTREFKTVSGFENKRVLVIGMGNSAADVACEISRQAQHVFMSTRRGAYVIQRAGEYGQPFDLACIRRWVQILPHSLMSPINYNKVNYKYNHANYGLAPNHRFDAGVTTISDDLPNRILLGAITMHTNVILFKEDSADLEDGTTLENIDIVVLATGFTYSFPFLDEHIIKVDKHYPNLYNLMFPTDLEQSTLAVIGLVQPFGSLPPILEMQARVASRVLVNKCQLPNRVVMMKSIKERHAYLKSKYVDSPRYNLQVYFIHYLDTLGKMIGCKPNMWKLFFSNPKLWWKVCCGPATPPQWRLHGPGRWEGAERAINSVIDKSLFPMKTRVAGKGETRGIYDGWIRLFVYIAVLILSLITATSFTT